MTQQPRNTEELLAEIERTARKMRRQDLFMAFVSLGVGAAYLAVMIAWGSLRLREFVTRPTGSGQWAVVFWYLLFFTLVYNVVHFPVAYVRGYVIERRFRLHKGRFRRWLWAEVKKYLVSTAMVVVFGELLYFFLRRASATWWFWAWMAYLIFALIISRYGSRALLPLFYKREDLGDDELEGRLRGLVERAGFKVSTIKRIIVGADTRKANAAVAGIGSTKEILVSDTLLSLLEPPEIEAVVAHELAHAKRRHGEAILLAGTVVSFIGFVLAAGVLSVSTRALGLEGVADVAGFPLIVVVFSGLFLLVSPLLNYISREFERSADVWAGRFTGRPEDLANALEKLASNNLAEKEQPRYYELLFSSHPSPSRRARYLRGFAARMRDGQ